MAKKQKSLYDENGRWVEERGRIKGALRRTFRLTPMMKETLQEARVELPPALKKDGEPGKKNQVRYRCAICGELFPQKWVQVDHRNPVVPLHLPEISMTYDDLVRGVFCGKENLQVVCSTPIKLNGGKSSCHRLKTNKENYIRDYLSKFGNDVRLSKYKEAKESYKAYLDEQKQKILAKESRKQAKLQKKQKQ